MPAFNPFKKKEQSPFLLSLDIGTKFVRALLLKKEEDYNLKIIKAVEVEQHPDAMFMGIPQAVKSVTGSVQKAVEKATFTLESDVDPQVYLALSGEMVSFVTVRMRLTRSKPEKEIKEKEYQRILKKAEGAALEEACREIYKRKGTSKASVEIIDNEISGLTVDGFPVDRTEGFKGEQVELSYFASFSTPEKLELLEAIVNSAGFKVRGVAAGMYAVLEFLMQGNEERGSLDALLCNLHSDTTDLGVVFNGNIVSSRTIPLGYASLGQENAPLEIWGSAVDVALGEMEEIEALPPQAIFFGSGAGNSKLEEFLEGRTWRDGDKLSFRVLKVLDSESVKNTEKVEGSEWVVLLALANLALS